jgi:hypothetical protein
MIATKPVMALPGIISAVVVLLALGKLAVREMTSGARSFAVIHIIIIVLQFVFAVFAAGNAEFMMMIPVLFFILIPLFYNKAEKFLMRLMAGMAIWNLAYGIIPLHYNWPEAERFLTLAAIENRNVMVIASDDQLLKSMIYYNTGNRDAENIYKSPAVMRLKGTDIKVLECAADSALTKGLVIYTDCLGPRIISRASVSEGIINQEFFKKYKISEVKSWRSLLGNKVVSRVEAKL